MTVTAATTASTASPPVLRPEMLIALRILESMCATRVLDKGCRQLAKLQPRLPYDKHFFVLEY